MSQKSENLIALGLVALALIARMIPHPPNFSPLIALAIFSGHRWHGARSLLVMSTILVASNLILGADLAVWATAGIFLLLPLAARWLPTQLSLASTSIAAATGSLVFFILSNFFVWALGSWYPPTTEGLLHCFLLAIPFFPLTFFSTWIYLVALVHLTAGSGFKALAQKQIPEAAI